MLQDIIEDVYSLFSLKGKKFGFLIMEPVGVTTFSVGYFNMLGN